MGVFYNSKPINNILNDGNTVAWYDYLDPCTFTKLDSSVSRWNDKLGSGHDLIQISSISQPAWLSDGVFFDGINDYIKTTTFPLSQPETIYITFKLLSYTTDDTVFDGSINNYGRVYLTNAPGWYTGRVGNSVTTAGYYLPVGDWGIMRFCINGALSELRKYPSTFKTGNLTSESMNGFVLGGLSNGQYCANIQVKEIILRKTADDDSTSNTIYNYLNTKYSSHFQAESILKDGSTVGWYDYTDPSILRLDTSVYQWNDRSNSSHHLLQTTESKQPKWTSTGILFDGVDDYMNTQFTYSQPEMIYIVFREVTWKTWGGIFDSSIAWRMTMQNKSQPNVYVSGGILSPDFQIPLNQTNIYRILFYDASSKFQINNNAPYYGNFGNGSGNGGGFIIGNLPALNAPSNIEVKEIILRKSADSETNQNIIYNYLKSKHGL